MLEKLYSYSKFGIRLGLENITTLLNRMGNPQNDYKTIHIAGTNGKGSVVAMLESVLLEAGYSVGKYISPHLVKFNERIILNREMISDTEIERYFESVDKCIEKSGIEPTFFEVTTAMMFKYFSDMKVDYVILETGMGGRYDATNVVIPEASVITNITMDHMQFLGESIEKIAYEKAGIIKKGVPLFFADRKKEVADVFKKETNIINESLKKYDYNLCESKNCFNTTVMIDGEIYMIPLMGDFQVDNFVLAYDVLRYLKIEKEIIKSGILKTKWEGRLEKVFDKPMIILDGAHNMDSAVKLSENINKYFKDKKKIIITSVLRDKEISDIFSIFSKMTKDVIFSSLKDYDRGLSGIEVAEKGKGYFENVTVIDSIKEAIIYAKNCGYEMIIISGSLFLVGEFKKEVDGKWLKENLY